MTGRTGHWILRPPQARRGGPLSRPTKSEDKLSGRDSKDRHREILETAARLICEKGYEGASIQDIAEATGLTKAGLYHYIRSKEHLLLDIQNYGMDVFEEQVLSQVVAIEDPLDRLRACMDKNILLVTHGWSKEVTIILHEHATLTGEARSHINARKRRYVRFLESSFAEAVRTKSIRPVNPTVAAFAFLGQVLWIYKWFRPEGAISAEELSKDMQDLFFGGLALPRGKDAAPSRKKGRAG